MEQRIYHGTLDPNQIASALHARFNHGNLVTQQLGSGDQVIVQIATRGGISEGGKTAISVTLQKVQDGIAVGLGRQDWLGVAASLGTTAFMTLRNPLYLLSRLDDVAQDIENLQLAEQIWETVDEAAHVSGATFELSERLKRIECQYCHTANPIGEPNCIACGAPLGGSQPRTCPRCGFVIEPDETYCPNCGQHLL